MAPVGQEVVLGLVRNVRGGGRMKMLDVLTDIFHRHGELNAELVVKEATSDDSFLHTYFEWDDSVAGHHYRLQQAGNLIRRARCHVSLRPESEPVSVRAFVHISPIPVGDDDL